MLGPALGNHSLSPWNHGPGSIQQILNSWFPYIEIKASLGEEKDDLRPSAGVRSQAMEGGLGSLCLRQGRELHYENPETKTSKHLLV